MTTTLSLVIPVTIDVRWEDPYWVARCPELDLLTSGTNKLEVAFDLHNVCRAQAYFAVEDDRLQNLFRGKRGFVSDRLDQLEKTIAELPKTNDGVPIVPEMTVWNRHGRRLTVESVRQDSVHTYQDDPCSPSILYARQENLP